MTHPTILVTNDDGIQSHGLHAVVQALSPLARVIVIAPDRNRSGVSRSITLGAMLDVTEHAIDGASDAFATSGTPTDCVRLAMLELAGVIPDLVVSGANRGLNIGDDVAFSGTVAAAFDAALNGLPAIAISQQSIHGELGYPGDDDDAFDYRAMRRFLAPLVERVLAERDALIPGTVLNVNVPGVAPADVQGVEVVSLCRRIYRDRLTLHSESLSEIGRRRQFTLYGDDPVHHDDSAGTDISAIARNCVSVTPLRFDVNDGAIAEQLGEWDLARLLG